MDPLASHTLLELHILPDHNRLSALDFFDCTHSQGGRDILKKLIISPKTSLYEILSFQQVLKYMARDSTKWETNLSRSYISAAETYFNSSIGYTMSQDVFQHWFDSLIFSWRNSTEFYLVQSGLSASIRFIQALKEMTDHFVMEEIPSGLQSDFQFLRNFFQRSTVKALFGLRPHKLSKSRIFYLDYYLRISQRESFRQILDIYYRLDAYLAIVKTARSNDLVFPEFVEQPSYFSAEGLWQPLIENAIANDLFAERNKPLCLLTGANTSGKTTFLKTCGLVVYLAHLGWPVPAKALRLSYFDRLFTSIQLTDDLALGYSHFYNEMMRIREIASALYNKEKCFVIIDELFRGTNADDGHYCSNLVLNGFTRQERSFFMISTHLLELVEDMSKNSAVSLRCFKTQVLRGGFGNTFEINEGIAREKIGRMILEKTGIAGLLFGDNE
ncbi:DNA mismatch repair protein MutS [Dyadobacter sp. CECT 9275]|uniref:DNA mismatch repair protein MutS n=1 Tax=Dyadobacter helix TaxID=2822344 RepID=A0A916JH78_9BACT|nr:DNA mismatch repair protein MutS [Dyadobacter sp. CECT 9275]CAG5010467.1 DNA mismatch repair protein MutS [Dyadobacter sp. CECT 9275]